MNRMQLFKEMYEISNYNLLCYSQNYLMTKPKTGYVKEWKKEREKVELIEELIEEEKNSDFHINTSMFNLRNNTEKRCHIDLAYLENREKGISCYLTIDGFEEKNNPEYMLVLSLHRKDSFEDEYENIYTRSISKDAFANRETLRKEMQDALDIFDRFIENDKKSERLYSKYYEDEETEELE